MLSFRFVGTCLIGLAVASLPLPLRAVNTGAINPAAGGGSAGGTTTIPVVPPNPIVPGNSPGSAGTLPGGITPSHPPAPPTRTSAPPLGTPVEEGSDAEKSVVQIFTEYVAPN